MLELKFAIYYRAACPRSQASYAVLAEESQAFFTHTNSISNSAILSNNDISLLSDCKKAPTYVYITFDLQPGYCTSTYHLVQVNSI